MLLSLNVMVYCNIQDRLPVNRGGGKQWLGVALGPRP